MSSSDSKPVIESSKTSVIEVPDVNGSSVKLHQTQPIINLDHGDPTMYESYWKKLGERFTTTISVSQSLSYFSNIKNLCWFMESKLEEEIKILHKIVGNATVEDHHIVVGTGSSQLIQAALYALCDPLNEPNPVSVVSAAPYYSTYKEITDFVKSGLFKWAGDAYMYDKDGPYVEMVTSPSNPDGSIREAVVKRANGMVIHDFAYYWPQYTAITTPADHDIMLFTVSKCTGHAGSRIGWALVRDKDVAKKMVKFMEVSTIGVSKEAQLRAASILEAISASCRSVEHCYLDNFFEYGRLVLAQRWKKLRKVIEKNELFHVPTFPVEYCNFKKGLAESFPAFAWMRCNEGIDLEKMLREHKILTRSGRRFGCGAEYVRVSMLSRDEDIDVFFKRLSTIVEVDTHDNK